MIKSVCIPYSNRQLTVSIPEERMLFYADLSDVPPLPCWQDRLSEMLDKPTAGPSLGELLCGVRTVLLLVEDQTRHTPVKDILPRLCEYLIAHGILQRDIQILICPGTHRMLTNAELTEKLGTAILSGYAVLQHDYRDPDCLTRLDRVFVGDVCVPVSLNRAVLDAELVIGLGNIIPHSDAGFSGGAKILNPGCCGRETVSAMHRVSALMGYNPLGIVENDCRHVIESVARQAGLRFIVNVVLNHKNQVTGIVAGDMVKAHRQGCQMALQAFGVKIPAQADIVISSSAPYDSDFWQCEKALVSAGFAVKEGGVIILAAPCKEGLAHNHDDFSAWMELSESELEKQIRCMDSSDPSTDAVAAGIAQSAALVKKKASIFFVSFSLPEAQIRKLGFTPFSSVQSALQEAMRQKPDGSIGVLPRGGDCVPMLP